MPLRIILSVGLLLGQRQNDKNRIFEPRFSVENFPLYHRHNLHEDRKVDEKTNKKYKNL